MFESRSIEEIPMEGVPSTSSDKTRRDATHILENFLGYDLENEEDKTFIQVLKELSSVNDVDGLVTLSC